MAMRPVDFDEDDDDQGLLEDEAPRQAAEQLHAQLELFPELAPGTADARRTPFAIDPENLKHLAQVTNLYPKVDLEKEVVAVEVAGNRLVATAHRGSITCRAAAPLKPRFPGGPYCRFSFGFPRWQLQAIGSAFSDALNCRLNSDRAEWTIGCGKTLLKLATHDTPNYAVRCLGARAASCEQAFEELRHASRVPGVLAPGCPQKQNPPKVAGIPASRTGKGGAATPNVFQFLKIRRSEMCGFVFTVQEAKMVCSILFRMDRAKTKFCETETRSTHLRWRDRVQYRKTRQLVSEDR